MRKVTRRQVVYVLFAIGVLWAGTGWGQEKPGAKPVPPARPPELTLGQPAQIKNLTVFPVLSRQARNEDAFITLDEGLASGKVIVAEVRALDRAARQGAANSNADDPFGEAPAAAQHTAPQTQSAPAPAGDANQAPQARRPRARPNQVAADTVPAQRRSERSVPPAAGVAQAIPQNVPQLANQPMGEVNRLMIVNQSDKPLYLMPGEIIIGGKQDRTLAHETIIPPGKKPVAIDVFCVEHGRWAGRAGHETVALAESISGRELSMQETAAVHEKTAKGEFVRSAGSLNKSGRQAVQSGKGQSEVWKEVAEQNKKSGAKTNSDAFTANYAQTEIVKQLQDYVTPIQEPIAKQDRVVGVIVAINGKPEMVDVFASTPLFRKLWPKLLKSYALDASGAEPQQARKACSAADAQAFIDSVAAAEVVETAAGGHGLVVTKRSSQRVDSFSAQPAGMGGGAGGFGGGLHSSGFAK